LKPLHTLCYLLFLSLALLKPATAAATPVIYVTNEVVLDGKGTTGVQQIGADLIRLVKSGLVQKGFEISPDRYDYSIRFRVETDVDYGMFGAKVAFVKTVLIFEKNGAEMDTVVYDERASAASFLSYGKEGEAYAKKASEYLVSGLLKSEALARYGKEEPVLTSKAENAAPRASANRRKADAAPAGADSIGTLPKGKTAGKFDVAVIIGNKNYKKTSSVDYAINDAVKMKELVVRTMGFSPDNVMYFEDATLTDFTETFGSQRGTAKSKLYNFIKPNVSNVFIYYVGHGAPDIKADKPEAYFVPVDADPQYISESGYKVQALYDNLSKLPAKSITVVLDSCFSGNTSAGLLFKGISALVRVEKTPSLTTGNSMVLTSTSDNQVSSWYPEKQHSLFTYFFIKGMSGEADLNGDRKITAAELKEYVGENVARLSKRLTGNLQQPFLTGNDAKVLTVLDR